MSRATQPAETTNDKSIFYPSEDGEPMAETPIHVRALILLFQAMEDFLAARLDVYVAADMFWYWEQGNPLARRAPDLIVIKGVGRGERRSFFSWLENGAVPCLIVELHSVSTWRENLFEKRRLYEQLGVNEYFVFDPEAVYVRPALQGFRRNEQGLFVPLEPDGQDRIKSEGLGLYFRAEGPMLRLIDTMTDQPVLTKDEHLAQKEEHIAQLESLLQAAKSRLAHGKPLPNLLPPSELLT